MAQPQLKFKSTAEMQAYFKEQQEKSKEKTEKALKKISAGKKNTDDEDEKPLSAMNKKELQAYADQLGVEYGDKNTNTELRELIQEELDEQEQ